MASSVSEQKDVKPFAAFSPFIDSEDGDAKGDLIRCLSAPESDSAFEELAKTHLFAREWRSAFSVYAMLYLSGYKKYDWLCVRLGRRIANENLFNSLYENAVHKERVLRHISERLGKTVTSIETSRGKLGYIGIASYRHKITYVDTDSSAESRPEEVSVEIFEKVFDGTDEKSVHLENLLFEAVPARSLAAPEFYGSIAAGEFVSLFHEFIHGEPNFDPTVWVKVETNLLYQLWSVAPPKALTNHVNVERWYALKVIGRLRIRTQMELLSPYLGNGGVEDISNLLNKSARFVLDLVRSMPLFIFHRDLHEGNVLLNSSLEPKVIDWEQWSLEPVGTGFAPFASEREPLEIDMKRLRAHRLIPDHIIQEDLLLMASIWGCHSAMERRDYKLAAAWLKRLIRYAQRPPV